MKHIALLGALLMMALFVSACGPASVTQVPAQATDVPSTSTTAATEAPTEAAAGTASPEAAATNTGTAAVTPSASTTATSEASVPVTGAALVRAAANFDYGPILVSGDDLPLYIYNQDTQNGGTSACTDEACTANWTPLTTEGSVTAGPGVIQSMLATITRDDGSVQVTYNGWPLYTYNGDSSPDSPNGQGAEPGWTLISPAGKAIPAE